MNWPLCYQDWIRTQAAEGIASDHREICGSLCSFSVCVISLRCVPNYGDAIILKAAELKTPEDLVERVDFLRIEAFGKATDARRAKLGQFPTPTSVSGLMASCLSFGSDTTKLLDAGAGVGSLTAAAIAELGSRKGTGRVVKVTAYEIDPQLAVRLDESLRLCGQYADGKGIDLSSKVITEDFIASAVAQLSGRLGKGQYNCAIMNPPYGKLNNDSRYRPLLRSVGTRRPTCNSASCTWCGPRCVT